MSGRFLKAPLVYMTTRINLSSLPALNAEQLALLEQSMIKNDFPNFERCPIHRTVVSSAGVQETTNDESKLIRGFFSKDRTKSLIIEDSWVEWRTSAYINYLQLCEDVQMVIIALAGVYAPVQVKEIVLSYADLIVPKNGRSLQSYFSKGNRILPIDMFGIQAESLYSLGQVHIKQIVTPKEKIEISLEQLQVVNGKVSKQLPDSMIEPRAEFSMPLVNVDDNKDIKSSHFALLTTRSGKLIDDTLAKLDFQKTSKSLHTTTSNAFQTIIDNDVCKEDWEFKEEN